MSGYKTHRFSQEPDDYEGPWPEEKAMTEWVMVPREPTDEMVAAMLAGTIQPQSLTMQMRARERAKEQLAAAIDAAPAAPQQAEPVAWMKFGGSVIHTMLKRGRPELYPEHTVPLFLHPPAAEVQRLRDAAGGVLAIVESIGRRAFTLDGWMAVQELRRALAGGE